LVIFPAKISKKPCHTSARRSRLVLLRRLLVVDMKRFVMLCVALLKRALLDGLLAWWPLVLLALLVRLSPT